MIEVDGAYMDVPGLSGFTEGPYIHKRNGIYFMSYAAGYPETIDYATSYSPMGPWTHRGRINDLVANSPTNHQAIIEFNNQWYFFYHNAGLPTGGEFRRSVCLDYLYYNSDGTIQKVVQTAEGVSPVDTSNSSSASSTSTSTTSSTSSSGSGGCDSSGNTGGCN